MNKKDVVRLEDEERARSEALVSQGTAAARTIQRAWILLKADVGPAGPGRSDDGIQRAFAVGPVTIYRVRQALVERGSTAVLTRRPKSRHRPRKRDGEQEAHLIALACSQPPAGRRRWTVRLLVTRFVELGFIDRVAPETARQTLKETREKQVVWHDPIPGADAPRLRPIAPIRGLERASRRRFKVVLKPADGPRGDAGDRGRPSPDGHVETATQVCSNGR